MKTFGIVLTVLGIVMLIWTGFSYTKKEKIVDVGPVQIDANKEEHVGWPSYTGGILVVAGVVLIIAGRRK